MNASRSVAILVTGMHRSGTSAVTRVLNLLGVELGTGMIAPGADNPFGFWENAEVVAIHERLLEAFGMAWNDPRPLPADWMKTPAARTAMAALAGVIAQQFANCRLWGVKDPRLCRFVPLWRKVLKQAGVEPRVLIVSRHPDEVAKSLAARNQLPPGVAQLLWARHFADAEEGSRGLRRSLVQFGDLLSDWKTTAARIASELDVPLRLDADSCAAVDGFLTASLYHNHVSSSGEATLATPLFEVLRGSDPPEDALARFAVAREAFESRIRPFLPALEGLCSMVSAKREQLAVAHAENAALASSLVDSSAWGESRDVELRTALASLEAARAPLAEAIAWADSRESELQIALAAATALQSQLSEATQWGATRDAELRLALDRCGRLETQLGDLVGLDAERESRLQKTLADATSLQAQLGESATWAASRNAELLKALAANESLQAELEQSSAWGASRHAELEQLLAAHTTLQSTLAQSRAWADSREAALLEALAANHALGTELAASRASAQALDGQVQAATGRLQALGAELLEANGELASRSAEATRLQGQLASSDRERDLLDNKLRESEREMDALRKVIEEDVRQLREDLQTRVKERDQLLATADRELVRKQLELDGLQHQANLLNARLAAVEHQLFHAGAWNGLRRMARSAYLRLKGASKSAVLGAAYALPGSPERKHGRIMRLRMLNEGRKTGTNSKSIINDLHQLAEGRWPAMPAYVVRRQAGSDLPALDISVVVYESERWIDGFMASLLRCDYPLDKITLLVRDHSPGNGTRLALERFFDRHPSPLGAYRYSAGRNAGFGAGHNHNFKQSKADHFLVCNVDGKFEVGTLRTLMNAASSSSGKVAAWELRQTPYEHPKYYDPVTMLTTWVSGACVLFLRSAYAKVGGFDDLIFMYGEDVDLSYRLRGRGYQLAYVPSAVFRHDSYSEPAQFKALQFHGSSLANILLRLRFGKLPDLLAIPDMWRELGRSAGQQGAYAGFLRNTAKLTLLGPLFLLTRFRRGSARIPFARWDYGLRRDGAFEPVQAPANPQPLVSIIVRTYRGRAQLLRQALASIANQTYASLEVLVVEDKGEEMRETAESCGREFGLNLTFIPCMEAGSNRCKTGNIGMAAARGEYFNLLDDDDLFFADHVEYLVARLSTQPELGACYSLAWETKIVSDLESGRYLEVMHSSLPGQRGAFDRKRLEAMNYIPIQAVLFRRELFDLYGGFNLNLDNLEDWNLWRRYSWRHDFQVCQKTTSVYHIPSDPSKLEMRQALLDHYYADAKRESDAACASIDYLANGRDRRVSNAAEV